MITEGLKPYFKSAAILGVGAMVFDTWLSGKFGWSISLDMAGIFGLVSLASGLLLVIAAAFWRSGHIQIGRWIAIAWVPVFCFNIFSNMGVATANRMGDVQKASIQAAKYDGAQDTAKENAANLKMWQGQLAKLKAENAWAATVSADALRAKLPGLNLAIEQEERRGGCGPKCKLRTDERDAVNAQIAIAEQANDLTTRIEATQKLVDKYRVVAASTDAGISHAANQSKFFAKLVNFSLYSDPTTSDIGVANEGMGMFTAIVLAIVSALMTYVGAYPHLMDINGQRRPSQPDRMAEFRNRRTEDDKPESTNLVPAPTMGFVPHRPDYTVRGTTIADLRALAGRA